MLLVGVFSISSIFNYFTASTGAGIPPNRIRKIPLRADILQSKVRQTRKCLRPALLGCCRIDKLGQVQSSSSTTFHHLIRWCLSRNFGYEKIIC
jgi:hypothetical protein